MATAQDELKDIEHFLEEMEVDHLYSSGLIRAALTRLAELEKAADEMEKEMELAMEQAVAFSVQSVNRNERYFALPYSFEKAIAAYRKLKGRRMTYNLSG